MKSPLVLLTNHEGIIKEITKGYLLDKKNANINLSQIELTQKIAEAKILIFYSDVECKPLLANSIASYIPTIINKDKKEKDKPKHNERKKNN